MCSRNAPTITFVTAVQSPFASPASQKLMRYSRVSGVLATSGGWLSMYGVTVSAASNAHAHSPRHAFGVERRRASRLRPQPPQTPRAIPQLLHVQIHPVQHQQPQIIQRRFLRVADVAAGFDGAAALAGEQNR